MALLAGRMFCCAMMISPACCWMAATTRGWQCPVLSTPARGRAAGTGSLGEQLGAGCSGGAALRRDACMLPPSRPHVLLQTARRRKARRPGLACSFQGTDKAASGPQAGHRCTHRCRRQSLGASARLWSTHKSHTPDRQQHPASLRARGVAAEKTSCRPTASRRRAGGAGATAPCRPPGRLLPLIVHNSLAWNLETAGESRCAIWGKLQPPAPTASLARRARLPETMSTTQK